MKQGDHPKVGHDGFVLLAVLVAIMIASAWAVSASDRISRASAFAFSIDEDAKARAAISDAFATALFHLAVSPRGPCGLQTGAKQGAASAITDPAQGYDGCITLDDRVYVVDNGARLRLQDDAGLFSVNAPSDALAEVLQREPLPLIVVDRIAALRDFVDLDSDKTALGAEANDYVANRLSGPPNRFLQSPYQVFDVIGWGELARPGWANKLGQNEGAPINLNSAGLDVLEATLGSDEAGKIIAARNRGQFYSGEMSFNQIVGRPLVERDLFRTAILPAETTRLRLSAPGARSALEVRVRAAPTRADLAWLLDYTLLAPLSVMDEGRDGPERSLSPAGVDRVVERSAANS